MKELRVTDINNEKFNPFGASEEELLANALDEAGLIKPTTVINDFFAKEFCQKYFDKRENYREATKLGNLLVKKGLITQEQLHLALQHHMGNNGKKLGDSLLALNICTPDDIQKCINTQVQIREDIQELDSFKDKIAIIKERLKKYF